MHGDRSTSNRVSRAAVERPRPLVTGHGVRCEATSASPPRITDHDCSGAESARHSLAREAGNAMSTPDEAPVRGFRPSSHGRVDRRLAQRERLPLA